MPLHYAKRIDENQREIVKMLREDGYSVQILSAVGKGCPDILVGAEGINWLFEIKNGNKPASGQRLTPDEIEFFGHWKGQVSVINCIENARNIINSKE